MLLLSSPGENAWERRSQVMRRRLAFVAEWAWPGAGAERSVSATALPGSNRRALCLCLVVALLRSLYSSQLPEDQVWIS